MCNADTNVEPGIPGSNGVSGYGVPKVCRDYESVKQWSEQWADIGVS
ncbi:hypothetical protein CJF31_00007138 [Rutstroemia sp. NJR-2017a BVV2]|nr:hypothetical protein CJF31_00007138 [Rutstroemia sp. NJR-2017a BVV2]